MAAEPSTLSFLGSILGGFAGGVLSAGVVEFFRRKARKERYAEILYQERLKAHREISEAISIYLGRDDARLLYKATRHLHVLPVRVVHVFREFIRIHGGLKSGANRDQAVQLATDLMEQIRKTNYLPELERLHSKIVKSRGLPEN